MDEEVMMNYDQPEEVLEFADILDEIENGAAEVQSGELEYPTDEELFADVTFEEEKPTDGPMMAVKTHFAQRTVKPTSKDKFAKCYITTSKGGWSGAIVGDPTDKECNVLSNCVGYGQGRFCEVYNEIMGTTGNKYKYLNCDAKYFISRAKKYYPDLQISQTPEPGSLLVMGHKTAAGHIIFVEDVVNEKKIKTSESAYHSKAFYNLTREYKDGHWGMGTNYYQIGFILNPAVMTEHVTPTVERDEHKDQLQVVASGLNVRNKPSLSGTKIGQCVKDGIYNILGAEFGDGYTWYQIAENQWCAQTGVTVILPKSAVIKIGDKVVLNGPLYRSASATTPAGQAKNKNTTVTRFAQGTLHPYNTTGDLGWCDETSLTLINPVSTKHEILAQQLEHAVIEADRSEAQAYEVVQVNVRCEEGYEVVYVKANEVPVENYKFIMPDCKVVVTAEVKKITHSITCERTPHGTLATDLTEATEGTVVHIYCTPAVNYRTVTVSVTGAQPRYSEINEVVFTMPDADVVVSAVFEEIVQPKYAVGDRVRVLRPGRTSPDGNGDSTFYVDEEMTISNIIWENQYVLAPYCYQLQRWDGVLIGFYKEADVDFITDYAENKFQVGAKVKIKAKGNSRPDGNGFATYGIGWTKEVLEYLVGEDFPYKVGQRSLINITQGYYKEEDLEEV